MGTCRLLYCHQNRTAVQAEKTAGNKANQCVNGDMEQNPKDIFIASLFK